MKRSRQMTLQPQNELAIPEETGRVARAAYPRGNTVMKMRNALGTLLSGSVLCSSLSP
jgi:hypothetical protein